MLRKLEAWEFDRYAGFAYELALDPVKSGYPTYADGIKTRDDFMARAREAFSCENEEILLYERDGKVVGWIHYFYLPEDRYLDTCAFCVADGMREAIAEFTAFAQKRFPGSELYLGFPGENLEAVDALIDCGFERIEESENNALNFDQYELRPDPEEVVAVARDNFGLFSEIHAQHDGDMYWNAERILADADHWRIYACLRREKAAGAIYFREDERLSEIFGVDFSEGIYDGKVCRALLTAALNDCKRRGRKYMVFFCEKELQTDAAYCGFRRVGEYVCFQKQL